ncbi:MAG: phosphate ABC transporter permease subunit PstC, partial [Pseudomonadota bacterium]
MTENSAIIVSGLIVLCSFVTVWLAYARASSLRKSKAGLPAQPRHYAWLVGISTFIPACFLLLTGKVIGSIVEKDILVTGISLLPDFANKELLPHFLGPLQENPGGVFASLNIPDHLQASISRLLVDAKAQAQNLAQISMGLACLYCFLAIWWVRMRMPSHLRARHVLERLITATLGLSSAIAIFVTISIALTLSVEALRFFAQVPISDFLFGLIWSPQMAIRADQVATAGAFGAIPVFAGTVLICIIAMGVAIPVGLFSAIYLAEYASKSTRAVIKPVLEILAGVPTIVYGFFAALSVGPLIRSLGDFLHIPTASESALAAGLVMGIMIVPFVSSLSDDVIRAVPRTLREGSLALGATRSESLRQVILRAATPGIAGAFILAVSRAIGETMIVVMAAGLAANLSANPFASVTTVTVQIVTLLVGDHEFDGPKTLSAFALGLTLFIVTFLLNLLAL